MPRAARQQVWLVQGAAAGAQPACLGPSSGWLMKSTVLYVSGVEAGPDGPDGSA